MGSGPGGGDYRTYLLSSDKERSGWTLWQMGHDYDTGKRLYCRVAYGWPHRGCPAKSAAELLLTQTWEDERDLDVLMSSNALVEEAGLLIAEDVERIELAVFAAC
jgi:2-hydroxychromene-2-carboxylate isomerase